MIKKFSNFQINEKLGVSEDVEVLSEFIISELGKAEPGKTYIFQREDTEVIEDQVKDKNVVFIHHIPKLNVNLYKVIIDYLPEPPKPKEGERPMSVPEALFDPGKSKTVKNKGYLFKFAFQHRSSKTKIWKHHIYHEVNHAFQFVGAGKSKMLFNRKYLRVNMMRNVKNSPIVETFIQFCYLTIKIEQGSFVAQLYGKVKHRKDISNIEDLQRYFKNKSNYEYQRAYELSHIDVEKLFSHEKLISKEESKVFFTLFKNLGNSLHQAKDFKEFQEIITQSENKKMEIISDEEYKSTLKNYTKYFNRVGKELSKKLDKVYSLLYDYYTAKWRNEKK